MSLLSHGDFMHELSAATFYLKKKITKLCQIRMNAHSRNNVVLFK